MTKLGLFLIAVIAACTSKSSPPAGDRAGSQVAGAPSGGAPPTKPAEPTGSATPKPGEPIGATAVDTAGHNMTGLRPHQAANCPSSLPGTTTRLEMTPRGVDVTVTAKDPAVARRLVALAQLHVRGRTAEVPRLHDQKHGGPGTIGYCPILVTDQTPVTATPVHDGVTVHVEARSPSRVAELQELIKDRAVRLPGYLSS
jgi:hypothetical protein